MESGTEKIVIKLGFTGKDVTVNTDKMPHVASSITPFLALLRVNGKNEAFAVGAAVKSFVENETTQDAKKWLDRMNRLTTKYFVAHVSGPGEQEVCVTTSNELQKRWKGPTTFRLLPIICIEVDAPNDAGRLDKDVEAVLDQPIRDQNWYQVFESKGYECKDVGEDTTLEKLNKSWGHRITFTREDGALPHPRQGGAVPQPRQEGGGVRPQLLNAVVPNIKIDVINGANPNPVQNRWRLELPSDQTIAEVLGEIRVKYLQYSGGDHLWWLHDNRLTYLPQQSRLQDFPFLTGQSSNNSNLLWIGDKIDVTLPGKTKFYPSDSTASYVLADLVTRIEEVADWQLWVEWEDAAKKRSGLVCTKNTPLEREDWKGLSTAPIVHASLVNASMFDVETSNGPTRVGLPQYHQGGKAVSNSELLDYLCKAVPELRGKNSDEVAIFSSQFIVSERDAVQIGSSLLIASTVEVRVRHSTSDQYEKRTLPADLPLSRFTPHLARQNNRVSGAIKMRLRVEKDGPLLEENETFQRLGFKKSAEDALPCVETVPIISITVRDENGSLLYSWPELEAYETIEHFKQRPEVQQDKAELFHPLTATWLVDSDSFLKKFNGVPIPAGAVEIERNQVFDITVYWDRGNWDRGEKTFKVGRKHQIQDLWRQLQKSDSGGELTDEHGFFLKDSNIALSPTDCVCECTEDQSEVGRRLVLHRLSYVELKRSNGMKDDSLQVRRDSPIADFFSEWAKREFRTGWEEYQSNFKLTVDTEDKPIPWKNLVEQRKRLPFVEGKRTIRLTYEADIKLNIRVAGTAQSSRESVPIYEKWAKVLDEWDVNRKFALPADANEWRIRNVDTNVWLPRDEECGSQDIREGANLLLQPMTVAYVFDLTRGVMGRMIKLTFETIPAPKSLHLIETIAKCLDLEKKPRDYRLAVLDSYTLIRLGDQKAILEHGDDVFSHGTYDGLILLGLCEYYKWDTTDPPGSSPV